MSIPELHALEVGAVYILCRELRLMGKDDDHNARLARAEVVVMLSSCDDTVLMARADGTVFAEVAGMITLDEKYYRKL